MEGDSSSSLCRPPSFAAKIVEHTSTNSSWCTWIWKHVPLRCIYIYDIIWCIKFSPGPPNSHRFQRFSKGPAGGVNMEMSKLWTEVTPKLEDQSISSPRSRLKCDGGSSRLPRMWIRCSMFRTWQTVYRLFAHGLHVVSRSLGAMDTETNRTATQLPPEACQKCSNTAAQIQQTKAWHNPNGSLKRETTEKILMIHHGI